MSDTLVAGIVGAVAGLLASCLSLFIAYQNLRKEYEGKFRMELISKQISACESLWALLAPASRSSGDERIIVYGNQELILQKEYAKKMYDNINSLFNSSLGLYYSKEIRVSLFELRDFLQNEFLLHSSDTISKTKASKFDGHVQNLRIKIRKEIGVKDLRVTEQGPIK